MRKILFIFGMLSILLLDACSKDEMDMEFEGDGFISLNIGLDDSVTISPSRSIITDQTVLEKLQNNTKVRIWDKAGNRLVRYYEGLNKVPEKVSLYSGTYKVAVTSGELADAAFEHPYYEGEKEFTVTKNSEQNVAVVCKVANSLVAVDFDPSLSSVFNLSTAKMVINTKATKRGLTYTPETQEVGYFLFREDDAERKLSMKFSIQTLTGSEYVCEDVIEAAAKRTKYMVSVKYVKPVRPEEGGGLVNVQIDKTCNQVDNGVMIYSRPRITGNEFEIKNPLFLEPGKGTRTVVWINSSSQLKNLTIGGTCFTGIWKLSKPSYDIKNASAEDLQELNTAGISLVYTYSATSGQGKAKVVFDDNCMSKFITEGAYAIDIEAKDVNGYISKEALTLSFSKATIAPVELNALDIYANRAKLQGKILNKAESTGPYSFMYKEFGGEWVSVPGVLQPDGIHFTADISSLKPSTVYQYKAVDNGVESALVMNFTTEAAPQLYNSGFEFWSTAGDNALIPAEDEGKLFWDSGNHGSITMKKNVTYSAADPRPGGSGTKSVVLHSQFVGIGSIGKFAAGNLFVGKYVGTDGTDGILDFGRPFTARPRAFSFWYKYQSCPVTHLDGSLNGTISKKDNDIASIYVALGDWDTPIRIRTKQKEFFNPDDPHIIAFGSFDQNQTVSEWTKKEVELVYRRFDKKPKYIVVVMSASKYGDYFTGGEGSTLSLDDFELIY